MSTADLEAVQTARKYYDSEDADNFYSAVWGGEDIHIGIYHADDESIFDASRRTQEKMADHLNNPDSDTQVIDLGSGYGGSARYLADRFGCRVVALNLSKVENEKSRLLNQKKGLDNLIDVIEGNFEEIPFKDESFDIVWSQDAFLHSPLRTQVISEAARVLKVSGEFIFTDPMKTDNCPDGVLQPILDRIHLEDMASPEFYRQVAAENGLKELNFDNKTEQLRNHYSAVLRETLEHEKELQNKISKEYLENMKSGLNHWIRGAENHYLTWGIFHFIKK